MTKPFRSLAGGAALAAGLLLVGTAGAGTPDLPVESYKKAADADLKVLQSRLDELAAGQPDKTAKKTATIALLLAAYADVLGDPAFKADVLKVGEAVQAKNYKEAAGAAKKLTLKPGSGKAGGDLPKFEPFEASKDKSGLYLAATMHLYANKAPGGLNIQKDLRDWTSKTNPVKLDPAAIELLAVRSAVLNEYALQYPNEKAAVKPENLKEWQKWSKDSLAVSKELIAESTKKTPDPKVLRAKLSALDAACSNCHNKYRDGD